MAGIYDCKVKKRSGEVWPTDTPEEMEAKIKELM